MMSIAIDPADTRKASSKRSASPALRIVLLTGLGGIGLLGLSAGAYSMLSGLAGPQLSKASIGRTAADWPDLKDGVPALVTPSVVVSPAPAATRPVAAIAADRPEATGDGQARALGLRTDPVGEAFPQAVRTAATPAMKRRPPMEKVAVLPTTKPVALVAVARTAALVAPLPAETIRARAVAETFAPPPPEASVRPTPAPMKRPAPPVARAKAAPSSVQASAAPAAAEPEAEETEVFGIKVPSLAPAGRKIAESVEALGNAVKSLSD